MSEIRATYRLQLNAGCTLQDVRDRVPYLDALGISHLYLSPILKARRDSPHGYDVVDPTRLDPKLGTEPDLEALVGDLEARDMGILLDIVPNHMATGCENPFWQDVLTHGRCSRYASWFDIDWEGEHRSRVLLPVLGDWLRRVVERGELELVFDAGRFAVRYFEHEFPLDPATVPRLLFPVLESVGDSPDLPQLQSVLHRLHGLPETHRSDTDSVRRRAKEAADALASLAELHRLDRDVAKLVERALAMVNEPGSSAMRVLLDHQPYRLAYWRRAAREINYRRFFTISHLVALRMEDPAVFEATHALVLEWVRRGWVGGLRIDHVDGLANPTGYLWRLRDAVEQRVPHAGGRAFPIFVEKILGRDEVLPAAWPVEGSTGYEFLRELEDVFLELSGMQAIERAYGRWTKRREDFDEVAWASKRKILTGHLAADVTRVTRLLRECAPDAGDLSRADLRRALVECIAALPIYRTYLTDTPAPRLEEDRRWLEGAVERARQREQASRGSFDVVHDALTARPVTSAGKGFLRRLQQLSGPAAAKGVEDTAFYIHIPLLARNEVGTEPSQMMDDAVERFHRAARRRSDVHPRALRCVTTHDTKRSADARARLGVLTQIPGEWMQCVRRWHRLNHPHAGRVHGRTVPDRNSEYHFYQALVAIWPNRGVVDGEELARLRERASRYMLKAVREAKVKTSWVLPDHAFEQALGEFVVAALADVGSPFIRQLGAFVRGIGTAVTRASLARTLIHLTAPGVPDIYQGDELIARLLVDPDNRRAVDFSRRFRPLDAVRRITDASERDRAKWIDDAVEAADDDRLKLYVTFQALRLRRSQPEVFVDGAYVPLAGVGQGDPEPIAFARCTRERAVIVLARRDNLPPGKVPGGVLPLPPVVDTSVWECVLGGHRIAVESGELDLEHVFQRLPVALLLPQ